MKKTVLIVDDEVDLLLAMRVSMEIGGYDVVEAASGEAALTIAKSRAFDAIILDILLPGIDGWEVIKRLRESGIFPRTPVIVTSAHINSDASTMAEAQGCSGFLAKPFSNNDLRQTLKNAIEHQSAEVTPPHE